MYALKNRSASDGVIFHSIVEPRVYEECSLQVDRIRRTQLWIDKCVDALQQPNVSIVELGCGTADISGPFAFKHNVVAVDCNEKSLAVAKRRFPKLITLCRPIDEMQPMKCDVLVMCETLEHLADPLAIARKWFPLAEFLVVSHPLDEPVDSPLSAGEHQWGFSELDFATWFNIGGMRIEDETQFQMGCYRMIMGRGRRKS